MVDNPAVITRVSHDIGTHHVAVVLIRAWLAGRLRFAVEYRDWLPQSE